MEFISQAHLSFPQTEVLGMFSSSGHGVFSGEGKKRQGTYRQDTQIDYYWLVDSLVFLSIPFALPPELSSRDTRKMTRSPRDGLGVPEIKELSPVAIP